MIPTLDAEGYPEAVAMIETARGVLDAMGNDLRGVSLHAKERVEGGKDNEQIADWLAKSGRDFFTPTQEQAEEAASIIAQNIEMEINRIRPRGKLGGRSLSSAARGFNLVSGDAIKKAARAVATKSYKLAMEKWMDDVYHAIQGQVQSDGSPLAALSKEYRAYKIRKFGFAEPIGKATGQLIENLDKFESARNVRMHKG